MARADRGRLSEGIAGSRGANPSAPILAHQHAILSSDTARFIFGVAAGSLVALSGIDSASLRRLVDEATQLSGDRRVLFMRLRPTESVEAYVEQVIAALADTTFRLWPVWFSNISFAICRDDTLGRQAASVIAHDAAKQVADVNSAWLETAAHLTLAGRQPRVTGALPAIELRQLSLAVSRTGLIIVIDVSDVSNASSAAALAHALEWVAQHANAAVVALFQNLPRLNSPLDRILYGARCVIEADGGPSSVAQQARAGIESDGWLVPWRGAPHPLSEIEQRLAAMLANDAELADLFCFNWVVDTVRGSRPKVDLVWIEGRLVIELDGYPDHTTRGAFIGDRHRDYELVLSGYTVLRLANDEVVQDFGRAIEKIRDLVRWRRSQMNQEG